LQQLLLGSDGIAGTSVNFIGSGGHGTMTDSDNEGHSGAFLAEIVTYVQPVIKARPNVVTFHVGTNDMDKNREISTAIDRLEAVIRAVASGSPTAAVLVARILFANDSAMQARTDSYNDHITSLVSQL